MDDYGATKKRPNIDNTLKKLLTPLSLKIMEVWRGCGSVSPTYNDSLNYQLLSVE